MSPAIFVLLACQLGHAHDATPHDAVIDAMIGEAKRQSHGLHLPDRPAPYRFVWRLRRTDSLRATAERDGRIAWTHSPRNTLGLELRVGEPNFDNSAVGAWQDAFSQHTLAQTLTPSALTRTMWRVSDAAYHEAIEVLASRYADGADARRELPDYAPGSAQNSVSSEPEVPLDTKALGRLLDAGASAATGLDPRMMATVQLHADAGDEWLIDSDGSRVRRPYQQVILSAFAELHASDGLLVRDHREWIGRDASELPDEHVIHDEIAVMHADLLAQATRPAETTAYTGPVIFEDQAAAALFASLLVPQISAVPTRQASGQLAALLGKGDRALPMPAIGQQVLPRGWRVAERGASHAGEVGIPKRDDEGEAIQNVELVQDGKITALLSSRTPATGATTTNGHGRAALGERPVGAPFWLDVLPSHTTSPSALTRRAWRESKEACVLVIRSLVARSALQDTDPDGLAPPASMLMRCRGQDDRPVRGLVFRDASAYWLRELAAATRPVHHTIVLDAEPQGRYAVGAPGLITHLSVPDVLVANAVLLALPADPWAAPSLPNTAAKAP